MKLVMIIGMFVVSSVTAHAEGCGVYKSNSFKTAFQITRFGSDFSFTKVDENGTVSLAASQENHFFDFIRQIVVTFDDDSIFTFTTKGDGSSWSAFDQNGNRSNLSLTSEQCSF